MKFPAAVRKSVKHLSSEKFKKRVMSEDPTMWKHVGILKEINQQGYITSDSQAGKHLKPTAEYDMWEKAYIFGFMLESKAGAFIQQMSMHTDKLAQVIHYSKEPGLYDNMPRALDIPLTINKVDENVQTHMSNLVPFEIWDKRRKELSIDASEKIVYVMCYDLQWNRNASEPGGLFKDVLRILKNMNKPKTLKKSPFKN